jgi:hypothetical protein
MFEAKQVIPLLFLPSFQGLHLKGVGERHLMWLVDPPQLDKLDCLSIHGETKGKVLEPLLTCTSRLRKPDFSVSVPVKDNANINMEVVKTAISKASNTLKHPKVAIGNTLFDSKGFLDV